MKPETFYKGLALTFIVCLALGGALIITQKGHPAGKDINLHLRLSNGWRRGEFPTFNAEYYNNGYPYPPAFHISIAILSLVFFTSPDTVAAVLQVLLYPALFLTTFFLVQKKLGVYAAAITVLLLATSPGFWDRAAQVIPQALDLALFPMAAYLFLEKKDRSFMVISVILIYNHFMYAALPLFALLIYSYLYQKESLHVFPKIFILSLPLLLVMGLHLQAVMAESGSVNEVQEWAVTNEPLFAIKYLGYPLFFLILPVLIHLVLKRPNGLQPLLLLWIFSVLPMTLFFPDRFIQYFSQPFAILGATYINELAAGEKSRLAIFLLLLVFALSIQYNLFVTVVANEGVILPLDNLSPYVR